MIPGLAADTLVLVHFAFILFAAGGGLLVLRWPGMARVHLPCAAWGAAAALWGWICPLTPLEQHLRTLAGETGYTGGFIDHYVMPLVYPPGLTRGMQVLLGAALLAANLGIYLWAFGNRSTRGKRRDR